LFATGLSFFLHDPVDAFIIVTIVLVSGLLRVLAGARCEERLLEKLLAIVQIKLPCFAMESPQDVPVEEIVPGDIVVLNAEMSSREIA